MNRLHAPGKATGPGLTGPLWGMNPESKKHSLSLGSDWAPVEERPTSRGIAIKKEQ